ncbi:TPA: oligosaccharide flippase family protein [Enterobacter cancerogenus]
MKYLEIVKKYSFFSVAPLLTALIQLGSVFVIGHTLSSSELGLAGILNTLIFILVFISDGGSSNYFIFRKILTFGEVKVINALNIVVSFVSILLFLCFSPSLIAVNTPTILCFFIISFSITMPLYNYSRLLVEKRFNTIAFVEVTSKVIFILSLLICIYQYEVQGSAIVYSWAISYLIRYLMFAQLCKKVNLYDESKTTFEAKNIIKRWWSYVHNQIFSQFLNYITLTADIFIISHFGGLEKVGVYSLCKDATLKISAVISPVIGKLLISHVVNTNIAKIQSNARNIFLGVFFVAFCVFVTWSLLGPYLLVRLRPEIHSGFELYIYAWAICGVLRMLINPMATIFQGLGETRKELYINIVSFMSFVFIFSMLNLTGLMSDVIKDVLLTLIGMYLVSLIYSGWILQRRFLKN